MNQLRCQDCKFYDPILPPRGKQNTHGWCSQCSVYPFKEGPGQRFPPGVKRVKEPGLPARPRIVRADELVDYCAHAECKTRR